MATPTNALLALDVGERRVGVALAIAEVGFAHPLITLEQGETIYDALAGLVREYAADTIVVGLPRGLDGQETAQTKMARAFAGQLETRLGVPVVLQDEALTSRKAEAELEARGKPYAKGDVDALAATYILEDFIAEQPRRAAHA